MSAFYTSDKNRRSAATARRQAQAVAKRLGVTLDVRLDGAWHEVLADAPDGHVFSGPRVHQVVVANAGPTTDGLWEAVLDDLRVGVRPCTKDDCDVCAEAS